MAYDLDINSELDKGEGGRIRLPEKLYISSVNDIHSLSVYEGINIKEGKKGKVIVSYIGEEKINVIFDGHTYHNLNLEFDSHSAKVIFEGETKFYNSKLDLNVAKVTVNNSLAVENSDLSLSTAIFGSINLNDRFVFYSEDRNNSLSLKSPKVTFGKASYIQAEKLEIKPAFDHSHAESHFGHGTKVNVDDYINRTIVYAPDSVSLNIAKFCDKNIRQLAEKPLSEVTTSQISGLFSKIANLFSIKF